MCDEDDADYCVYGNPLDPIDEDTLRRKKPISIEDQVAKNEKGRRVFHGAFTGGFTAGYGNTVGSEEGWTPCEFISSRSIKLTHKTQKAEDFMDDEDKGEFGICPTILKVKSNYENDNYSRKRERFETPSGPIPGVPVLQKILEPVNETIGVKLLMKMGWKVGQGVGPRVTQFEKINSRKQHRSKKLYGCSNLPENKITNVDNNDNIDDEDYEDNDAFGIDLNQITLPPDEHSAYFVNPKENTFGLGYKGIDRHSVLSSKPKEYSQLTVRGKTIRGQAFGVGAYEEDDEDIYGVDDMSQYDFALGESVSDKKPRHSKIEQSYSNCIEDFHVSLKQTSQKEAFPQVTVPADFIPMHKCRISRFEVSASINRLANSMQERSQLLADAPSVLESKTLTIKTSLECIDKTPSTVQKIDTVFKPFIYNPQKQARYEKFLMLEKYNKINELSSIQPSTMTEWEQGQEKMEFISAARLYRPLSQDLADRFTSGKHLDDTNDTIGQELKRQDDSDLNSRKEAGKKEMFGSLTRREYRFVPCKLLCKRFNVPEPPPNNLEFCPETIKKGKPTNIFDITNFAAKLENRFSVSCGSDSSCIIPPLQLENKEEAKNNKSVAKETEKDIIPEAESNIDLFKAIFLSSSDEDEEEESTNNKKQTNNELKDEVSYNVVQENKSAETIKRTSFSPPKGIFANLDLDALMNNTNNLVKDNLQTNTDKSKSEIVKKEVSESYGPKLPDKLLVCSSSTGSITKIKFHPEKLVKDDGIWVEKLEHKKYKKSKHKHSNEHKKKKKRK